MAKNLYSDIVPKCDLLIDDLQLKALVKLSSNDFAILSCLLSQPVTSRLTFTLVLALRFQLLSDMGIIR